MKKQIFKAVCMVFSVLLFFAIQLNSSFAGDPSLKEKIVSLASAGKVVPVVYWQGGINGEQTRPPSIIPSDLFSHKEVPDSFKVIGNLAMESFNTGYGVTCFKNVPYAEVPKKESKLFGSGPDWTATDYNIYVSVVVNGIYTSILGQSSKSIKLTMKCEIKIMENYEKNGEKKSDTIKTLYASASTKAMPVKSAYATWEEFVKDIPPASLIDGLKEAVAKEIAKYIAK